MFRMMLSGKIHTATITRCLVDYEGSLEIDPELLKEANILPYEKILVANRNSGSRLETYAIPGKAGIPTALHESNAIPGKAGSRDFCLNGPAARLGKVGDVVTIMAFSAVEEERLAGYHPTVIVLDENNEIKSRHN